MKTKLLFYLILVFGLNSYSQIINVANGLNLPYSIFIDGNDLYVPELNSNKITKFDASLTNQTSGTTFATGTNIPSGFARYGNYLYMAKSFGPYPNDKIIRIDLTIPNSLPTDFLTVYPDANGINQGLDMGNIIVIGNYMYITDNTLHGILKVDLTQNNPIPSIVVTGINTPYGLASKGNDLYISQWDNGNLSTNYSSIYKIDVSQANPTLSTVISGLGGIPSMAVKCDYLFFNEASDLNISYINVTQPNPIKTVLLNSIINLSLAIKDDFLYFDQYGYNEVSKINISSIVNEIPTFNPIAPICAGSIISPLPTTSNNNITGTWSPALNNMATTTYTFTPDAGQCAASTTMKIVVNPITIITTTATACGSYTWAKNGVTYTTSGTYTIHVGACGSEVLNLTIIPAVIPTFTQIAPICSGSTLAALPTTSNGITGTWSPALNNLATRTYTFTPNAGQCATTATMTIVVNPLVSNSTTVTACDTYTWSVNNAVYTTSGTYTYVNGCTTNTLVLTIQNSTTWYIDADSDGYGNPAVSMQACTQPTGYVSNNLDCNDSNALINPCATEIRTDGIDNNCNGLIDEIVTKLYASQCGMTMTTINQLISAIPVTISGSTICGYSFKVTKMIGGVPSTLPADIQTINRSGNTFQLTMLPSYAYNTTYLVQVSVCMNGVWQPYGPNCCTITTPNTLTNVVAIQCGTTLTTMGENIVADMVFFTNITPGVLPWEFEIKQVSPGPGFGVVQTIDKLLKVFSMNDVPGATYDTTYSIRVRYLNADGTWSSYGFACTITTPPFPRTQLQPSQCGFTATSGTQTIWATGIPTIVAIPTHYKFRLSNASLSYSQPIININRTFYLNQFVPLGILPGTTYNVEVSMEIGGVFGPYGSICTITTPNPLRAAPVKEEVAKINDEAAPFEAKVYPNPYTSNFFVDLKTTTTEMVDIRVYDMLGKLVENRTMEPASVGTFELGIRYPSGVYNVIVTQGENHSTLRVVKR